LIGFQSAGPVSGAALCGIGHVAPDIGVSSFSALPADFLPTMRVS
jgi:hypothetical protein